MWLFGMVWSAFAIWLLRGLVVKRFGDLVVKRFGC